MSRLCGCTRNCRHLVPNGSEPLLPSARLLPLLPMESILIDAADAFDSDGLVMESECEVHGPVAVSNATCLCEGGRVSAVEFVQALFLDIRVAHARLSQGEGGTRHAGQRSRWDGLKIIANG